MLKEDRIKEIENYVIKNESVSLDKLCSMFDVSKNTIRRDIAELEKKDTIKKVYGGITLNNKMTTIPFQEREIKNKGAKQIIAKEASKLVNDGDIIFIDSGTTTMHMIPYLANKRNLTIITNNVNVLVKSFPFRNLNVLATGGSLYRKTNSIIGIEAVDFLRNYNISKCFMASTGVSIEKGVTNSSPLEFEIKRSVINQSNEVILLVDHSKFEKVSLMTYCDLSDIDIFITDKPVEKNYENFFLENDVELIITDN